MRLATAAGMIALTVAANTAFAQTRAPRPRQTDHFFLTIGYGEQFTVTTLDRDVTPSVYAEPAAVHQHFRMPTGARVEIGGGVRFSRLGIGAAVGSYRRNGSIDITAQIPHPFFFNQPRSATFNAAAHRTSTELHIDALLYIVRSRHFTIAAGAGPTYSRLSQAIETALNLSDSYPYDTVAIQSISTTTVRGSGLGGHVVGSVAYMLTRGFGGNLTIRFTEVKATTPMETGANDVRWNTGGLQATTGVRFVF